eukprot:gnl/TRDRNA2_/TRDRNA2_187235_c0_seq1.p1 gnl/TRDRNA2_/TRDRNA2_187235_c0~~gnl/TRDRNA2_/TRDRNA2_187235_c0_seq1.p1  ORF type:complete len:227 (+),score=21.23 gnl/TRDRNA2_/TRDRNA2_187235_c0_seq1:72-752(+)
MPEANGVAAPLMSGHGTDHPHHTVAANMFKNNAIKTRNAPYRSQHITYAQLHFPSAKKDDPDYYWRSHATTFARGGLWSKGKEYTRDVASGTWYGVGKHEKDFHYTGSGLSMRFSAPSKDGEPVTVHKSIYAAPCAKGFITETARPNQHSVEGRPAKSAPLEHVPHMLSTFSEPFFKPASLGGPKETGPAFGLGASPPRRRPRPVSQGAMGSSLSPQGSRGRSVSR